MNRIYSGLRGEIRVNNEENKKLNTLQEEIEEQFMKLAEEKSKRVAEVELQERVMEMEGANVLGVTKHVMFNAEDLYPIEF